MGSPAQEDVEESDSELDDDYDPAAAEAGKSIDEPVKRTSTLNMKKKKTVTYPTELTSNEKKKKLLEYGTIKDKEDGKIIDDEADEQAEIQYSTVERLMSYYGHWYQFGLLVAIEQAFPCSHEWPGHGPLP